MLIPSEVFANGLPNYPIIYKPGGLLVPLQNVPITVDKEELKVDLTHNPIAINAQYTLTNPLPEIASVQILFPIDKDYEAKVLLDSTAIKTEVAAEPKEIGIEDLVIPEYWIDPYTNERYRPPNKTDQRAFDLIRFSITLQPHESKVLSVSYQQTVSYDPTRFFRSPVNRLDYLLLPAKHWAGYKNLEITLFTPERIQLASNFPFTKTSDNRYSFKSDNLPSENLSVFFAPQKVLVNGQITSFYERYFLQLSIALSIVLLALTVLCRTTYKIKKSKPL